MFERLRRYLVVDYICVVCLRCCLTFHNPRLFRFALTLFWLFYTDFNFVDLAPSHICVTCLGVTLLIIWRLAFVAHSSRIVCCFDRAVAGGCCLPSLLIIHVTLLICWWLCVVCLVPTLLLPRRGERYRGGYVDVAILRCWSDSLRLLFILAALRWVRTFGRSFTDRSVSLCRFWCCWSFSVPDLCSVVVAILCYVGPTRETHLHTLRYVLFYSCPKFYTFYDFTIYSHTASLRYTHRWFALILHFIVGFSHVYVLPDQSCVAFVCCFVRSDDFTHLLRLHTPLHAFPPRLPIYICRSVCHLTFVYYLRLRSSLALRFPRAFERFCLFEHVPVVTLRGLLYLGDLHLIFPELTSSPTFWS